MKEMLRRKLFQLLPVYLPVLFGLIVMLIVLLFMVPEVYLLWKEVCQEEC